jgi:hypothetical protein
MQEPRRSRSRQQRQPRLTIDYHRGRMTRSDGNCARTAHFYSIVRRPGTDAERPELALRGEMVRTVFESVLPVVAWDSPWSKTFVEADACAQLDACAPNTTGRYILDCRMRSFIQAATGQTYPSLTGSASLK